MLETIRTWELAGEWAHVRQCVPAALSSLSGDELARAHLALSTAYFLTAESPHDWRMALHHAERGRQTAERNGLIYTYALQKLSSLLVDMGRPQLAKGYAKAYLRLAPRHPAIAKLTPYVTRAQGDIAYQECRFGVAEYHYRCAMDEFKRLGQFDEIVRSCLNVVWSLVRAGKPDAARQFLPAHSSAELEPLIKGAETAILAAEGKWNEAYSHGTAALIGTRMVFDFADAAEVALIMSEAARRADMNDRAAAWLDSARSLAARQTRDVSALLVLSQRQGGGDSPDQTASRGAGGWHPDARFTTGVA